jgi:multicomponent Na+:H+ antiporter subunit D
MQTLLLNLGAATAVMGGAIAFMQRHIKRLLAFSTISHMGVMLAGLAILSNGGMAGFLLYLVGHGLTKAALFMVAGILMSALGDIDELTLHGRARDLPVAGICFGVCGLLLAGLPVGAMETGASMIDAALHAEHALVRVVLAIGSGLTGAAVLRAGGRVFLGWGPRQGPETESRSKQEGEKKRPQPLLLVPLLIAMVATLVLNGSLVEGFASRAAAMLRAHDFYVARVLGGDAPLPAIVATHHEGPLMGWIGVAVALAVAGLELGSEKMPRWLAQSLAAAARPLAILVDRVHTGFIGDYAVWASVGVVMIGAMFVF